MNWANLSPRAKQITLALGGAAILAVIALMSRRSTGGGVTSQGTGGEPPFGSTFADNGEAAAGLGTAITGGLGDVATALNAVNSRLDEVGAGTAQTVEVPTPYVVEVPSQPSATDAAVIAATPNGNQIRQTTAKKTTKAPAGKRGQDRAVKGKTVVKNGPPKSGAKPKKQAKPKAAPKPKPKPKPKPSSPSRRPAKTPQAPARRSATHGRRR